MKLRTSFNQPYLRAMGVGLVMVTAIATANANRRATATKSPTGGGVATRTLTRETPWGTTGTKRQTLTSTRVKTAAGTIKVSSLTQEYVRPESDQVLLRRSVERTRGVDGATITVDVDERFDGADQSKTLETTETLASGLVRREISTVHTSHDNGAALPLVHILVPPAALRPLDTIVQFARTDKRMLTRVAAYKDKPKSQGASPRKFYAVMPVLGGATFKSPHFSAPIPHETTIGFEIGESPRTMAMRIASHQWGLIFDSFGGYNNLTLTPRNLVVAIRDSVSAFFMAP